MTVYLRLSALLFKSHRRDDITNNIGVDNFFLAFNRRDICIFIYLSYVLSYDPLRFIYFSIGPSLNHRCWSIIDTTIFVSIFYIYAHTLEWLQIDKTRTSVTLLYWTDAFLNWHDIVDHSFNCVNNRYVNTLLMN